MATFGQIKERIIAETKRDDLSDDLATQLATHFARACEYYADRKFWFNSLITTATTVAGTATVSVPATIRRVDRVTIPAYNIEVEEVTLNDLDDFVTQSLPEFYSYYNDSLRFWPIPDAVYTLNIYGIAQVAAPSADSDTSIWTGEAQDLIVNHTKMTLYRDQFRDPEGFQLAAGAVTDHLARLQRETARRLKAPLRPRMRSRRYSITTDR